ncbi:MAG: hypothetical protein MI754_08400 [Chromatiales bacterium]|nr:hypothetical protein [Chromatiales bacterium]
MRNLISEVRATIPFGLPEAQVCLDSCQGCSQKLLDYLEAELESWEQRLDEGIVPNFGDLNTLARSSRKVYRVLQSNGLIEKARQ